MAARWSGSGYNAGGAAAALVGERPAEASAASETPTTEGEPSPGPAATSMNDRWRATAHELGGPDVERHQLGGWWRRTLRRVSLGAYKGLEPEAVWRHRLAINRALAPMPDSGAGTVVVAQPKGGVGKSPLAMLITAAMETYTRKTPVLWDCNENAGARWSVGRYDRTVEHLFGEPERGTVLTQVEAAMIDQDQQAYQVIAAPPQPRNLTDEEFAVVHGKLVQRCTQVVIDTGNTVTAANFVNALGCADVVVVPTDLAPDTMAPTLALFEALEGRWGMDQWQAHVVGVETNPVDDADKEWRTFFESSCAEVVQIPYDAHIAAKGQLRWSEVAPTTKEACLRLVGAITDIYRNNPNEE